MSIESIRLISEVLLYLAGAHVEFFTGGGAHLVVQGVLSVATSIGYCRGPWTNPISAPGCSMALPCSDVIMQRTVISWCMFFTYNKDDLALRNKFLYSI